MNLLDAFPLAINSMPVSYDGSSLLKCSVSMSYIRYIVQEFNKTACITSTNPFQQAQFNSWWIFK